MSLAWAFGLGAAGQTYFFQLEGQWYESTLATTPVLHNLDLAMGAQNEIAHTVRDAAGHARRAPSEVGESPRCHATNAVKKESSLRFPLMTAGDQCERCHARFR